MKSTEKKWMERAIDLAWRGAGLTRPNPPVGAVIVKNGRCVGEGYHRKAGGPHAEIIALRQAGPAARGADLYVTLEPCSTKGKTPPCTDAIIHAGIRRVVFACHDPNPRHRGRSRRILRRRSIEVVSGHMAGDAGRLVEPFRVVQEQGRPRVVLKMAMTLDGRTADRQNRSQWITGPASRAAVQELRRQSDAVLVGVETVLRDDPSLLPRPAKGRQPYRVIADSRGRVPLSANVFHDGKAGQTIIAVTGACPEKKIRGIEHMGARVLVLPAKTGRVSFKALLKELGRMGLLQILCEGGAALAGSLVQQGLVDEFQFFTAPKLLGGSGTRPVLSGFSVLIDKAVQLNIERMDKMGDDLRVVAAPVGRSLTRRNKVGLSRRLSRGGLSESALPIKL